MALEQSINTDSKSSGGVIGISQIPSALERRFLTIHERASITSALKAMYGLQDGEQASHKEAAARRVKRDEEGVKKMMGCFSSGLMTDPFTHDSDELLNIATGVVLPEDVAQNLVRSTEKGQQQMNAFVERCINSNAVGFWEPIPNMKMKTFSSTNKKIRIKSNDKLVTVKADRDLFDRLLIVSNTRQICLKEVLSFELSPVPYSPASADGSLRKGAKSVLCSLLEKDVNVQRLTRSPNPTVVIIDGMAVYRCPSLPEQVPFVSFPKSTTTSSVPRSFPTTVCKSTWSSTNTGRTPLKEASVNDGEHPLVSRCRSEVLPLQYPGNGESTSPILRMRYGLNYLI